MLHSDVVSGWDRWTMSRGPDAKGAPTDREGEKENKVKKREGRRPGESVVHWPRTSSLRHCLTREQTKGLMPLYYVINFV